MWDGGEQDCPSGSKLLQIKHPETAVPALILLATQGKIWRCFPPLSCSRFSVLCSS